MSRQPLQYDRINGAAGLAAHAAPAKKEPRSMTPGFSFAPDLHTVPLHTPAGTFTAELDLLPSGHVRCLSLEGQP